MVQNFVRNGNHGHGRLASAVPLRQIDVPRGNYLLANQIGPERQAAVINGRHAIAIIGADNFDLAIINQLETSKFLGLAVVVSVDPAVVHKASEAGKVARLVVANGRAPSEADFVRAIVESDEPDMFIEGDPYLAFINLAEFKGSTLEIEAGLLRLREIQEDRTLSAPGLGLGRMSAFLMFGQFDGPNSISI